VKDRNIRKWLKRYARAEINKFVKNTPLLERIGLAFSMIFLRRI